MFPSDLRVRRDWRLPLVGGAELNRMVTEAIPPPVTYTSLPYPVLVYDNLSTGFTVEATKLAAPTLVTSLGRTAFKLIEVTMTAIPFTGIYHFGDTVRTGFSLSTVSITAPILLSKISTGGQVRTGFKMSSVTLKVALIRYSNWPVEPVRTSFKLTSVTLA